MEAFQEVFGVFLVFGAGTILGWWLKVWAIRIKGA